MQLLIVDDEAHWVDNLSMNKPWEKLGIQHVHKAYSPHEALQIIGTHPIDIVVSDILMPEMTGIELIERIHRIDRRIKCIILSGYSDFEFAKQAVQRQAVDYLLKPPLDEELFGAVRTAVEQLNQEWENVSSYERTQFTLRENLPLLRGQLLLDALRGQAMAAEEWKRRLETYGLPIVHGKDCALLLVRLEEEFGRYINNGLQLMEYAMMNMAEEIMDECMDVWGVKEDHGYLVFLLQLKEHGSEIRPESILEQMAIRLQSKVKQFLKGVISIVITEWFRFPDQLPARYRQSIAYFRTIVGDEREFVMRTADTEQPPSLEPLESLYVPPSLVHLLEAARWEAAHDKLDRVFEELNGKWSESWEHCMEAGFRIASSFSHLAHKNNRSLAEMLGMEFEPLVSGEAFRSISRLRKWSLTALEKLIEQSSDEVKASRTIYVRKLQEFVEKNLHRDVTLRAMADHVNLHPTHLSKIYKIETGEGLSEYVLRLRMERACHLLTWTEKRVYEISSDIGYLDPAYFIKVFKRQFGVTPQEYKELNQ